MQTYTLIIHAADEGGYWAEVPALDGCFVQGETVEEILRDAPDAIASHIDALRAFGTSPSPPGTILLTTVRIG